MKAFFLGAGSSCGTFQCSATPVPITTQFGKMLQSIDQGWREKYPALFKIVSHLKLPSDDWSLEDVWSCMDYYAKLAEAIPRSRDWKDESPQLKKAILDVYGRRCDQAADRLPLNDSYTLGCLLKRTLKTGDILISFNYDTIVERLALRFGHLLQSVCAERRENAIVFAKPHGSTSWTLELSTHQVKSASEEGTPLIDSLTYKDVDHCLEPLLLGTVPIKSELIREVQTCMKSPDVFETITKHWRAVVEAVRDADSLIIIGYSFPKEDQYGRFLFQEGMRLRKIAPTIEFYELMEKEQERAGNIAKTFGIDSQKLIYRGQVNPPSKR